MTLYRTSKHEKWITEWILRACFLLINHCLSSLKTKLYFCIRIWTQPKNINSLYSFWVMDKKCIVVLLYCNYVWCIEWCLKYKFFILTIEWQHFKMYFCKFHVLYHKWTLNMVCSRLYMTLFNTIIVFECDWKKLFQLIYSPYNKTWQTLNPLQFCERDEALITFFLP